MDWISTREAVVAVTVLGAIPSVAASVLQMRGNVSIMRAKQLNDVSYGLMTLSMVLFIVVGFRTQ